MSRVFPRLPHIYTHQQFTVYIKITAIQYFSQTLFHFFSWSDLFTVIFGSLSEKELKIPGRIIRCRPLDYTWSFLAFVIVLNVRSILCVNMHISIVTIRCFKLLAILRDLLNFLNLFSAVMEHTFNFTTHG